MDVQTLGIRVDASGAITVLDQFGNAVGRVEKKTDSLESKLRKLGLFLGAGWLGHKFFHETAAAQDAMADLQAAVAATGGSAGKTLKELDDLSVKMQRLTRYSDETAKSALSVLLMFNRIDGKNMERVAFIAANLSTRMGRDLVGAAQLVGRALQDPANGMQMLQRQFRLFSESEIQAIKLMADTGNAAAAQEMIMRRLEKTFRNAALASRMTLGGSLDYLKNTFNDLFEVSQGGTSILVKGINALGVALERVKPRMGQVIAIAGAAVAVWVSYRLALQAVVAWQALVATAQVVQAFISLALAIRGTADAAALLSLAGGGVIKLAATVVALTVGWLAYKKIMAEVNKETEAFTQSMKGLGGAAPGDTTDTTRTSDLLQERHLIQQAASQELEIAEKAVKAYGQQEVELQKLRNLHEASALIQAKTVERDSGKITQKELNDYADAVQRAQDLKDTAAELNDMAQRTAAIWENAIRGIQGAFSDFFYNTMRDGLKSFGSLVTAIRDMFLHMVAELLAMRVMQALLNALSGQGDKSAANRQVAAAAVMLQASNIQAAAAATMAKAAGVTPVQPGGGGGGGGGVGSSTVGRIGIGIGGFGLGMGIGSAVGGAGGALGGAAGGAAMGFALGGPIGALVGGLSGLVGGIFGAIGASKRHREEMRALQLQYEEFTDSIKLQLGEMTDLEAQTKAAHRQFQEMRKQQGVDYSGWDPKTLEMMRKLRGRPGGISDEKWAKYEELNRLESEYIKHLEEEAKTKKALNDAALNIPEGYKVAAAIFRAMDPEAGGTQPGWEGHRNQPITTFGPNLPYGGGGGRGGEGDGGGGDQALILQLDGEVLARGTIRNARKKAARQFGDSRLWSQVRVT